MFFLIDYERRSGQLVGMRRYASSARNEAEDARLALELDLRRLGLEREVVLLEASSEDALRRTHRRYFESWDALANPA
jgi:hypothetical protein